jgi:sugar lactone lactonase YvrE
MRHRLAAFTLLLLLASTGAAQPHGTDLIVGSTSGRIFRLTPTGTATTVGTFSSGLMNMLTVDIDNRHIVALNTSPVELLRIDAAVGQIVATIWSGPPLAGSISWIEVDQDGDYLVTDPGSSSPRTSALFKVKRDGSAVITLFAQPNALYNAFAEDKSSGDWILGDFNTKSMVKIDRITRTITTIVPLGTSGLQGAVQDPQRFEIYVDAANNASVVSYNPVTNVVTTLTSGLSTNSIAVDRSPAGDGTLLFVGLTSGTIQKVSRSGTNLGSIGNAGGNPLGITVDRGRNLAPQLVRAPNDRVIHLDFPGQAGMPYVFALSLAGYFPGVTLPDARVIPLNVDPLLLLTARGALPPVLLNNIGLLSAQGRATVQLDLNPLTPAISGIRIWMAAITLDPAAPLGIGRVSGPLLFVP